MLHNRLQDVLYISDKMLQMADELKGLVVRAQNGEKKAFGEIYNLFLRRIYRFAYFLVGSRELAEDVTQNTFLKAWKALATFCPEKGTIQGFLFSIARNLVTDYRRKKKEVLLDPDYMENICSAQDLEEEMATKEDKKVVLKALSRLDSLERQIIVLRYFEEMSFTQISQVVGMQEGALRVRVHRVLKKLRKILTK